MNRKSATIFRMRNIYVLNVIVAVILWSLCLSWMSRVGFLKSLVATVEMILEVLGAIAVWSLVFFFRAAASRKAEALVATFDLYASMIHRFIKSQGLAIRYGTFNRSAIASRRNKLRHRTHVTTPHPGHSETQAPALKTMKT